MLIGLHCGQPGWGKDPLVTEVGLGWRGGLSSCLIHILVTTYDLQLATVLIFPDGSNASFVH